MFLEQVFARKAKLRGQRDGRGHEMVDSQLGAMRLVGYALCASLAINISYSALWNNFFYLKRPKNIAN